VAEFAEQSPQGRVLRAEFSEQSQKGSGERRLQKKRLQRSPAVSGILFIMVIHLDLLSPAGSSNLTRKLQPET